MSERNDDIEKLLNEYRAQKKSKENQHPDELEPPKKRDEIIDFSKSAEAQPDEAAPQHKGKINTERLKALPIKKIIAAVLAIVLLAAAIFAATHFISYHEKAYLTPYTQKYPDVTFPDGILEKYCDEYGSFPDTIGHIAIEDIALEERVNASNSQALTEGCEAYNYVFYLDSNELEQHYNSAKAYNASSKCILYSNLFEDYTFQVVGAFYTNTRPEDDDGYVFPYNVTEKMTLSSTNQFIDRINSRLLYNVSTLELTRQDLLLTISCPTDYKDDYRFVVICKAVDKINPDATATEKTKVHITDSEYEALGIENPYRFAAKWYPEVIVTDNDGVEATIQKTSDDYKQQKNQQ